MFGLSSWEGEAAVPWDGGLWEGRLRGRWELCCGPWASGWGLPVGREITESGFASTDLGWTHVSVIC